MWHGRDSNPPAFSFKEMLLNGKTEIWYSTEVKHPIDYAMKAADNGRCPGGVYPFMLSYAQTESADIPAWRAFYNEPQWLNPFLARPVVQKMPRRVQH